MGNNFSWFFFAQNNIFYCRIGFYNNSIFTAIILQYPPHVRRFFALRKSSSPLLDDKRQFPSFKKCKRLLYSKLRKRRIQGLFSRAIVFKKQADIVLRICDITSSTSRDTKLFSKYFIFLKKKNLSATLASTPGRHHASGSATDNNNIKMLRIHFH